MKKRKHEDTTVSLHPLTFDEAVTELVKSPKRKVSRADSTKEADPEPETSE